VADSCIDVAFPPKYDSYDRALLQSNAYEWKLARGLGAGTDADLGR